jgi:hypothetical protein
MGHEKYVSDFKILVRPDYLWDHRKGILQGRKAREENVGLVRFELTIDGSLRHASVLQRVIIKHRNPDKVHDALSDRCQRDEFRRPIVHHLRAQRTQRPLEPVAIPG